MSAAKSGQSKPILEFGTKEGETMNEEQGTRFAEASEYYEKGMQRVKDTPEPEGQKFPCGSRVRIADNLGQSMRHFPSSANATVRHVYAHAFGGDNVTSYCLDIDGYGEVSWFHESQLKSINGMSTAPKQKD